MPRSAGTLMFQRNEPSPPGEIKEINGCEFLLFLNKKFFDFLYLSTLLHIAGVPPVLPSYFIPHQLDINTFPQSNQSLQCAGHNTQPP